MNSNRQLYKKDKEAVFAIQCIELYNELWQKARLKVNRTSGFVKKIIKR